MPSVLAKNEGQLERAIIAMRAWLKDKGKIRVEYGPPKRSLEQNNYIKGIAYPIMYEGFNLREQGYTIEDMNDFLCGEFTGWREVPKLGKRPVKTTSQMTTTEASDFILFFQKFAAERGVYVPDPNEET